MAALSENLLHVFARDGLGAVARVEVVKYFSLFRLLQPLALI